VCLTGDACRDGVALVVDVLRVLAAPAGQAVAGGGGGASGRTCWRRVG